MKQRAFSLRSVARAAGLLAVAATISMSVPRIVSAQGRPVPPPNGGRVPAPRPVNNATQATGTAPLRVNFIELKCNKEGGDNAGSFFQSQEPYVIFYVADISALKAEGAAFKTDVFGDVDTGDVRRQNLQLWHPTGFPRPIVNADDIIILASLLESDDDRKRTEFVRVQVNNTLNRRLPAYKNAGLGHDEIVRNLTGDMRNVINASRGGDDVISLASELFVSETIHLAGARAGRTTTTRKRVVSKEGNYTMTFEFRQ
jgi:hypothetical protein